MMSRIGIAVSPCGSPMNDAVAPCRASDGTNPIALRAPDASKMESHAAPLVISRIWSRAVSGSNAIAPSDSAWRRRVSTGSTANTCAAPCANANSMPNKPIGPNPTIATREPGETSARLTPKCAVASASVSSTAWSSEMPSGIFIKVRSAFGTCANSA